MAGVLIIYICVSFKCLYWSRMCCSMCNCCCVYFVIRWGGVIGLLSVSVCVDDEGVCVRIGVSVC